MTWLTDLARLAREPVDNAFVAACTPARILALVAVAELIYDEPDDWRSDQAYCERRNAALLALEETP